MYARVEVQNGALWGRTDELELFSLYSIHFISIVTSLEEENSLFRYTNQLFLHSWHEWIPARLLHSN